MRTVGFIPSAPEKPTPEIGVPEGLGAVNSEGAAGTPEEAPPAEGVSESKPEKPKGKKEA